MLGGKSLIHWAIDAAIQSQAFGDRIYISSDDPRALAIGKQRGIHLLRRSAAAATHHATLDMVIGEVRDQLHTRGPIYVLGPTSPFRNPETIRKVIQAWAEDESIGEILSVVPDYPYWTLKDDHDGGLVPLFPDRYNDSRQILPPAYRSDGGHRLVGANGGRRVGIPVPHDEAVDVNNETDLAFAEFMLKTNRVRWIAAQKNNSTSC